MHSEILINMAGFVVVVFLLLGGAVAAASADDLKMNFYSKTCPAAENIVRKFVHDHISEDLSLAASLLRLHFHDCFVRGCDASVLLDSSPKNGTGNKTEKVAPPNLSLRGFEFIDKVKSHVEKACPEIVSCADIIALVARDGVSSAGGPSWDVPTGRRDGEISIGSETLTELPFPTDNITTLQAKFENKGLNLTDLTVLSGAHTIGFAHCTSITNRLYNFTGKETATYDDQDPTLDSDYASKLKVKCPTINTKGKVELDPPGSNRSFDLGYYRDVLAKKGLFGSDAALLTNVETKEYAIQLQKGTHMNFYREFAISMEKMGRIDVKTGSDGQIHKICGRVN